MESQFKSLFSPIKVGNVLLPNRITFSGHVARFYPPDEPPNERQLHYLLARAKGGVGMIMSGPHFPFPLSTTAPPTAYQSDDIIPALRKFTDAFRQYPTKVFAQLNHWGAYRPSRVVGGSIWNSSPVWKRNMSLPGFQEVPHAMDKDDIKRFVEEHGKGARRLKEGGFDGIELTAIHGGLLHTFLSPIYNTRTDEYGGSLENRLRIIIETIAAIREAIGPDMALGIRFTGDDLLDWAWWTKNRGNTLDEGIETAKMLEATGLVDYIFACAGGSGAAHIPPSYYPLGAFTYIPAAIKEVVNLPVVAVARINDPMLAENILANNQADIIAMCRGLIADPEWPNKARDGRPEEIRRCVACNEGCIGRVGLGMAVTCAINYEAGREYILPDITQAETRKKVMIVGGGAAGLETARVAALRGHQISLFEKEDILAKALTIAAKAPAREDWEEVRRYYKHQVDLLGVDVRLGVTVTPEMVMEGSWDVVVVATGAKPFIPEFPGSDGDNIVEMHQVLQNEVEVGERVLVVAYENHMHGLTTADFLASRGKRVELINESLWIGGMVDNHTLQTIYTRLHMNDVVMTPSTGLKEVRGNTAVLYNLLTGKEKEIEGIDTVVTCTDGRQDDSLYYALKGKVKELYEVGQCVSPRQLLESVADGHQIGRAL
jgi:2,4-dienoyl-CoA reductase-like NADH-dependent reductase (Old Yellow Enzyme family)/thioredoxin reductase